MNKRCRRTGRIALNLPEAFFTLLSFILSQIMKLLDIFIHHKEESWLSIAGSLLLIIVLGVVCTRVVMRIRARMQ